MLFQNHIAKNKNYYIVEQNDLIVQQMEELGKKVFQILQKNQFKLPVDSKRRAPVPKDIKKTSNSILYMNVTYMHCYRALNEKKKEK